MTHDGRTIYGFIKGGDVHSFGAIGIDGSEVYTLPLENISALISRNEPAGHDHIPKESLLRNLTTYQSAIETVMAKCPVIPVKFGTLLDRDEAVIRMMEKGKDQIAASLKDMENKIELDVVALWRDLAPVLDEIGKSEEILAIKKKAVDASKEAVLRIQIELGKRVKALLDKERETIQSVILPPLVAMAEKHRIHALMDDSMIMNGAFLINGEDADRLEGTVAGLDRHYEDRINFRIIGPLPPFSFRTIEIRTADYEELKQARKVLELPEQTTQREIRDHYRQLSKKNHPDRSPGHPEAQKQYEAINQAYKTVTDYCTESTCSFGKQDVAEWVSLKAVGNSN